MRSESLFEYRDYKKYVIDHLANRPRGERSRLATALQCHAAYISLVLGGSAHFSLEQAERLSEYFAHTDDETHFFLLMVQSERAGTSKLKRYFGKQMQNAIESRFVLQNRLKFKRKLSSEDQATYYSAWYYPAIHMMVGVPKLQTLDAIQQYLRLPRTTIAEVLRFLVAVGLAEEKAGRFQAGNRSVHLGGESKNIPRAHAHWRLRALWSLDKPNSENFHYSSVISIAAKDVETVKSTMVRAIEEIRAQVQASAEEEVYCYNFDFFTLREG